METITHTSGLRVTLPEGMTLAAEEPVVRRRRPPRRTPGVVPMPDAAAPTAGDARAIAAALTDQDFALVGALQLEPSPEQPDRVRAAVTPEVAVKVDLAQDEDAVVLLEQDGLYAWHFDVTETSGPKSPAGTRRRGRAAGGRQVTFRLPLGVTPAGETKRRGWLSDLVVGRAQAFVFKFAGRFLLERGAAFLERKVQTAVVVMDSDDPSKWKPVADLSRVRLPNDRPVRVLLFVHGTFSSTRGGFAALCATPWGRVFLAAARASYDAVIGFDHPTLSVDPLVNATALLRSIEARKWGQPLTIDAVCHSRGGITLRSLTELLLPATSLPVRVERAVFVGAVNGGTELAEPKNWRSLINIYTNIAAGVCRAIAMFPQTVFAATLTAELFKSVGVLAKVLANQAVTEKAVPGLAAMQPTGPFITELNKTQPGQPTAADSQYYAITSEFRAALAIDSLNELPRQLLLALADSAVGQLIGVANDLVVNTDSMTRLDPQSGTFIKDTLAFGINGVVYHTNYFLQPQVANALARWFELELPHVASPTRLRGFVRGGASEPLRVPAHVDSDVLVVLGEDSDPETRARILQKAPSYVVVERMWQGQRLRYAFQAEEVLQAMDRMPGQMLEEALNLHEYSASAEGQVDALPQPRPEAGPPSAGRVVALDGSKVVGVAEAGAGPTPLMELVRLAKEVGAPTNDQSRILSRRTMPSFVSRGPREELSMTAPSEDFPMTIAAEVEAPLIAEAAFSGTYPLPTTDEDEVDVEATPQVAETPATNLRRGPRRRGSPPSPSSPPSPQTPQSPPSSPSPTKVTCHFLAEMDDDVVLGDTTSVDVTLSREVIQAARVVSASGEADVQADRKLTIEIIPKKNFIAVGDSRADVELPEPGSPAQLIFDVKATDVGDGEILVRIRQGTQPLANLVLRCGIVAARTRPPIRRSQNASVLETPPGPQPLHQLTILEVERGGKMLYHFTLDSPSLGLKDIYESRPLTGNREDFIKGIYEDIEDRYLNHKADFEQFQKELREVGGGLWDELFPEALQAALWKRRDAIESIQVYSEEPFIPWELVHLKEPGKGLPSETRFFGQMGLVRWLHNVGWPTTQLRARAGRCRYVIPHYPHPDYELPGAEKEAEFLEKQFQAVPVDPHGGPLRKLLEAPGAFDLLHFACHGVADSRDIARAELLLAGRLEGGAYVTEKFRASVIEQLSGLVGEDGIHPIVALNACQAGRAGYKMTSIGGFSRAFLKQGAGMFIAAMWSVGDEPARNFTETLYKRLLAKDNLAQATIAARKAAHGAQDATWLAYTVYGNPNAQLIP